MSAAPGIPRNLEYRDGALVILDQTRLPHEERYLEARDLDGVIEAIRMLRVRGAPAIGIAAAYALCVALSHRLRREEGAALSSLGDELDRARADLLASRPTAVNLAKALARMERREAAYGGRDASPIGLLRGLEQEARDLHAEEAELCEQIAAAGLSVLPEQARLLTHCNAGPLATGGIGTALGVILRGHENGRRFTVFVDETRPLLQGARLTSWELKRAGVPFKLIPDGAASSLIVGGEVDAILVGADRVAANGDTANKIGTLPLALAASRAGVPFYVAAPLSSFDFDMAGGTEIPIEERGGEEVTHFAGHVISPAGVRVYNPAFDVTPGDLVTAFLSERGVLRPPYDFMSLDSDR